ncbi:type IV pilus modification PilV family protein [Calditerrivibrio sp.]|uniref:type IV pilus modification PilV family protein n=1 Tax=Calditerrivibrio sp. TaxID=2792612 RepID=UPI003D0F2DCD
MLQSRLKGFGMVEALVSIFIFAIVLLGLNYSLILTIGHNYANFMRNTATKIAQSYMDKARGRTDISTLSVADNTCDPDATTANSVVFIDNVNYSNSTVKFVSVFSVIAKTSNYYKVNVKTCYKIKGVKKEVVITSDIYPGKGGL